MGRTPTGETEPEMARRHAAQGARTVAVMRAAGHDAERAEQTLRQFEETQRPHVDRLRRPTGGSEEQAPAARRLGPGGPRRIRGRGPIGPGRPLGGAGRAGRRGGSAMARAVGPSERRRPPAARPVGIGPS